MDTPVVFDYSGWAARYPELAAFVIQATAQAYFNEAQLYCDNSPTSRIPNSAPMYQRTTYLNMLTAHIAALNAPLGTPSSPLVGRISNASQGSVNVTAQMDVPAGTAQWYAQTKYGIAFWTATTQFRSMLYAPGCAPKTMPFGINRVVLR